ncbi:MAG: tyrosine-type recombinase/integrase [Elusimicrobiota bacterium]
MNYKIKELIHSFLSNQNSVSTKERYEYELNSFFEFLNYPSVSKIQMSDILHYKESLKNLKPGTVAWKLKLLKTFFEFLIKLGEISSNPALEVKVPKYSPAPLGSLTADEAKSLLKAPNKKTLTGKRDYAILSLFLSIGIRIGELVKLTVSDICKGDNSYAIKVTGKGNKERILKIPEQVYQTIKDYLTKLNTNNPYLFPSNRTNTARSISQRAIALRIKQYADKVHLNKSVHPHLLRHTCFTLELSNRANIKQIQVQAGHSSLNTTSQYLHTLETSAVDSNPLF